VYIELVMTMKIAIPIWQDRVSPVFDSAGLLLVVELADGAEVGRSEERLTEVLPPQRVARLKELSVDVLICGAVSRPLADMIASSGIALVPFISGESDVVLGAYLSNRLPSPQFMMPGCWGRGPGRGFGMGRGPGPGRGRGRGRFRRGGGPRQW
jgi:predicted Fe-Mo cluster-binding NifX family protein